MSDELQFVAAARQNFVAEVLDKLKFVEHPQQNPQEVVTLELGKPVERELSGVQAHSYQITLAEGQYASVVVEQRGIDLIVQLLGAGGKSIADFDSEIRIQGEEKIELVAETAGSFRLLVKAKYPRLPAGRYEIRLIEVRNATEEDRFLYEARRLETASRQMSGAGKYTEALPLAEKALELRERVLGAEHPDLVYPLLNLASINYFKGDYAKGEALCLRGLMIAERALGPEHLLVGRVLYNLALFYGARSDEAGAEMAYQRAIVIQEKVLGPDHPLITSSLVMLATVYREKGDFVRAEPLLQRALVAQEKTLGEEHNNFAGTLNTLAGLYREKGDYAQAEPLYQRSVAIREKTNHPFLAPALNNLANLYRDMGDYERAEPLYLRSISIKEKLVGPNHPDVANSRGSLAFIYYARGDYAKAETLYLSTLPIVEKALGPNNVEVGWQLSYLADLYFATNDYSKAEPLYHRALYVFEVTCGTDYYHIADILVNLAKISAAEGKIAEALVYQARANAIIEHNLALNLAVGSERQKLAYLAKLPEQMSQAISLHVRFAANDLTARELAATAVLERKGRVQDALSNSLTSLRSRFSAEDRVLLDQLNDVTSRLARLALNEPQGMSPAEYQKRIKTLEGEREKLEGEISSRSAGFYERSKPVTLAAVQAVIPKDAALIEYAVYRPFDPKKPDNKTAYGEPRYIAYVIRRQGDVQWKELGDAKEIDASVDELRQALRDPQRKDTKQLARAVDEKVMQPVRALTGDATQLLISPDGELNLIPFAALVDEQGRYLIQRYSFTYLTSGRDLLRMQVARESKSKPLVVANPSFGEPASELLATTTKPTAPGSRRRSVTTGRDLSEVYFAPLGGTAQEARSIQTLFPDANVLTGAQATESAVKQINAPRVLHLATHGFFLSEPGADRGPQPGSPVGVVGATGSPPNVNTQATTRGIGAVPPAVAGGSVAPTATRGISANSKIANPLLRSGLALANANLRNKDSSDDGILTALEASGLNLWGTKLVVLSACDTGVGEVRNGEGVYGLRRAFVLAGAESLVMSLWPVSDYTTRELMTSYYRNLKQGMGRGEALRTVQLDMLKRNSKLHPFYWANFIQSGEWANLDGKR
ncbi:MAG TPA: CHAT domain-containing tetratricopeptide repeat protein [Pyrinomonadaceae bacterium]|nr:CHAT domain-containing tetratricopeptide repeat protein [Pyrinomonadaceae bacterium]